MLATSLTAAVYGVDAHLVRVEADTAMGFPRFTMVGLPDSAVKESEGRIRAALRNCGYSFKWDRRITINLAPAGLRKVGSSYDLATAMGLLAADGVLPPERLRDVLLVGELALDGSVRGVPGLLPMMLMARRQGITAAIVPAGNAREAAILEGLSVYPVTSLMEAVSLTGTEPRPPAARLSPPTLTTASVPDMAEVRGQLLARRGLEVAAAGGHNLLLMGPPGSGKTMLARRLRGILPPLSPDEAVEATAIHSAWGGTVEGLLRERPFRSPHHTASDIALVGGGSHPRPGEISLAHRGVLFLDELPEFRRHVLETLRQPLEEGAITLSRARGTVRFPARFQLVAAMNLCPCGARGHPAGGCRCSRERVEAYRSRVSGPVLDRIDLHVEVAPLAYREIAGPEGESSAGVAGRVCEARARQERRRGDTGVATNAALDGAAIRRVAWPDEQGAALLESATNQLRLSARGHDRVLRVARTLADLAGASAVRAVDVAEALQFRSQPA